MYDRLKSSFTLRFNNLSYVLISDNSNELQTMSVTNDAENVVKYLKDNAVLIGNAILYYVDTDGRVDILEHDGNGTFTGFKAGYENEEEFWKSH